jgi:hypothetical protein
MRFFITLVSSVCALFAATTADAQSPIPESKTEYNKHIVDRLRLGMKSLNYDGVSQDRVMLRFTVGRDGAVKDTLLIGSTGSIAVDSGIVKIFEPGSNLPAFPPDMTIDAIVLNIPVFINRAKTTSETKIENRWERLTSGDPQNPFKSTYESKIDYTAYIGKLQNGFSSLGHLSYLEDQEAAPCLSEGHTDRRGNAFSLSRQISSCNLVISRPSDFGFISGGRETIYAYYRRGWINAQIGNKNDAKRDFEQFLRFVSYLPNNQISVERLNNLRLPREIVTDALFGIVGVTGIKDRDDRLLLARKISRLLFDYAEVSKPNYIGSYSHSTSVRACIVASAFYEDGAIDEARNILWRSLSGKLWDRSKDDDLIAVKVYTLYSMALGQILTNKSDLSKLPSPAKDVAYTFRGDGIDFSGDRDRRYTCNEFALLHSFYMKTSDIYLATATLIPAWLTEKAGYESDARWIKHRLKYLEPLQQAADRATESGALREAKDKFSKSTVGLK